MHCGVSFTALISKNLNTLCTVYVLFTLSVIFDGKKATAGQVERKRERGCSQRGKGRRNVVCCHWADLLRLLTVLEDSEQRSDRSF